uniref:NADH dehydrogenase subunit 6 n=1 Tax=Pseudotibiozus cerasopus TaxID=2931677 RepID=A0A8T9JAH7_9MYRI|nr:NADH dehydrogenase subunit 6 [Pseudotibiozus cerasopus]UOF70238.1 NADH dehydrogenase subunit 6 [Pseudotibiozus cerasopus]
MMMMFALIIFPLLFHPMMMGILIILLSLTISINMWLTFNYSWLAYILFLVFLGALLVLFIYISTLAPNEKFLKLSPYPFILMLMSMYMPQTNSNKDTFIMEMNMLPSMKIFSLSLSMMTLFMAIYLLLTLIIISSITLFKQGPLRMST